jgi:hypothetical protein
MTPENFKMWLTGYFELAGPQSEIQTRIYNKLPKTEPLTLCYYIQGYFELSERTLDKWDIEVRNHLKLVFTKLTPVVPTLTKSPSILDLSRDNKKDYEKGDYSRLYPFGPDIVITC